MIITASGLSFLGLEIQPPTPEWGAILFNGRTYLKVTPWITIFRLIALMTFVFGFNLLENELRHALDPRLRE